MMSSRLMLSGRLMLSSSLIENICVVAVSAPLPASQPASQPAMPFLFLNSADANSPWLCQCDYCELWTILAFVERSDAERECGVGFAKQNNKSCYCPGCFTHIRKGHTYTHEQSIKWDRRQPSQPRVHRSRMPAASSQPMHPVTLTPAVSAVSAGPVTWTSADSATMTSAVSAATDSAADTAKVMSIIDDFGSQILEEFAKVKDTINTASKDELLARIANILENGTIQLNNEQHEGVMRNIAGVSQQIEVLQAKLSRKGLISGDHEDTLQALLPSPGPAPGLDPPRFVVVNTGNVGSAPSISVDSSGSWEAPAADDTIMGSMGHEPSA